MAIPSVTTSAASAVGQTSATLNGTINPNGLNSNYYFEWGLSSGNDFASPANPTGAGYGFCGPETGAGSGTAVMGVSLNATGLKPGTTYHARLTGYNSNGTSYGPDITFTTGTGAPVTPPVLPQTQVPTTVTRFQVRQEPAFLTATIKLTDGRSLHVGPEDPADASTYIGAAINISFETNRQGGFGPADIVVGRAPGWEATDSALLGDCTIYDRNGRVVHVSRVIGLPRTGVNEVEIQTEGYVNSLDDNHAAAEIFRDQDLASWLTYSNQRKINLLATRPTIVDLSAEFNASTGGNYLRGDTAGEGGSVRFGAQYDAGAARLGAIYVLPHSRQNISDSDANWSIINRFCTDDVVSNAETFTHTQFNSVPFGAFDVATTTKRWFDLAVDYAGTLGATTTVTFDLGPVVVYGQGGMALRPGSLAAGYKVSEMVPYIVERWAPLLTTQPDSIEDTTYEVIQAKFTDPDTTAKTMIDALVLFGGNNAYPLDYGVWENNVFHMHTPGNYGRRWRFRRDEGMEPDDQGPDASERWNGVIVSYNPGDGSTKTVGPPGSNSDVETDTLTITDPSQVWNAVGVKHWGRVDAQIADVWGAALLGQLTVAEKNRQLWRGSVTVKGGVKEFGSQAETPPYMIRAGDQFVVEDDRDQRLRLIESTRYDEKARACEVTVGAPPDRFETMLARAGVVLSGAGVS